MRRSPFHLFALAICSAGIFFSSQLDAKAGLIPDIGYALFGPAGSPYFPGAYGVGYNSGWYSGYNTSYYAPSYTSYYSPGYTSYYAPSCSSCCSSCVSCNCSPCSCSSCGCGSCSSCFDCCGSCSSCAGGACSSGSCSSCGYAGVDSGKQMAPKPDQNIPPSPYNEYDKSNNSNSNKIEEYKQPSIRNEYNEQNNDGFEGRGNGNINNDIPLEENNSGNEKKNDIFDEGEEDTLFKPAIVVPKKKAPEETEETEEKQPEETQPSEGTPGENKEDVNYIPELKVQPLNVGRTITWNSHARLTRIKIESRFSNPVVARMDAPLKERTVTQEIHIANK